MYAKEKVNVAASSAFRLLHPMHTVLVSCIGKRGKPDIITLAWAMPASIKPPLLAVSISPRRHSHSLIQETKEFVVNIPTIDLLDQTEFCGTASGREHDKFKETGLTPETGEKVKPPLIRECVANLECKLHSQFDAGAHTIFVGEIVDAHVVKEAFWGGYNLKKAIMIFHIGGIRFATLAPRVFKPKRTHPE